MIITEKVNFEDVHLIKKYSDKHVKIQCNEDMNIYSVCYLTENSNRTFIETDIPVDDIKVITAAEIVGLSAHVLQTISCNNEYVSDILDGTNDDKILVNGGSAN